MSGSTLGGTILGGATLDGAKTQVHTSGESTEQLFVGGRAGAYTSAGSALVRKNTRAPVTACEPPPT